MLNCVEGNSVPYHTNAFEYVCSPSQPIRVLTFAFAYAVSHSNANLMLMAVAVIFIPIYENSFTVCLSVYDLVDIDMPFQLIH